MMVPTKKFNALLLAGSLMASCAAGTPRREAPDVGAVETVVSRSQEPGGSANSGGCAMDEMVRHGDPARTRIYSAPSGTPALFLTAKLAVNTDGASRSYHPDDPRGKTRALNNIANAISRISSADGADIDCAPRTGACFERYITTFEAARAAGWNPHGHPRVQTDGMIPWRDDPVRGWKVPCTIESGPFTGFFVSQTAFIADRSKGACDQSRYLDSLTFNAIVLPRGAAWKSQGATAETGNLVAVHDPTTGKVVFGIVGDRGPAGDLGEGTIALAAALAGRTLSGNETYADIKKLALEKVHYVVFPARSIRDDLPGAFAQADVDRLGKRLFDEWGGMARVDHCSKLPR